MKKVLVVDDESDILELLDYNLTKEGFQVEKALDGVEAIEKYKSFLPDIILMDVMMPNMDGIEACRQIKSLQLNPDPYIVFLTARSEEFTEVAAWEAGGNDYLIKPVKPRALISRLKSKVAQNTTPKVIAGNEIEFNGLKIDHSSYTIHIDGTVISLPKKEFKILYLLAQNPNKIYSREDILKLVWEEDTIVLARTVDVHIRKLREKLGDGYIKTIKGVGYMFVT